MAKSKSSNEITPYTIFGKNPRQLEAWQQSERHRFLLYGGAAGGGKSFFLRWWAAFYLLWLHFHCNISRAQVGLFCEDYPSLMDRQVSKIRAEFPPELGELKQGVTLDFALKEQYGSGRILLRNLDDPSKYLSSEFAGIAVDELTRNDADVFNFLRLRLRWPGIEKPRFVAGTNPGQKGHGWVNDLWNPQHDAQIASRFPKELERLRDEFYFVPAKPSDNPFLPETYERDTLATLPDAMQKAYREGRWDLFAGQYFDFWGDGSKYTDHEANFGLQPWNTRWISIDWGFEHPSCVHWHALTEDGITRTYRELHQNRLGPRELGAQIASLSIGEKISEVYLSPDAYAKRTDELTIAEQIGDELAARGFPRPMAADNDRVGGWMLLYQMLQSGHWIIGKSCRELIRSVPVAVRDERRVEDIAKFDASNGVGGDDALDCARYGIKSRHRKGAVPLAVRAAEKVKDVTDNTSRAMILNKFLYDESKKQRPTRVFAPKYARFRR